MKNPEGIKKVLFNEVSFVLSIAASVFWLMTYINSPIVKMQSDILLIQKDIENISKEHSNYSQKAKERDDVIIQIGKDITRIYTLLEKDE